MSRKNKSKNVTSIAIKINSIHVRDLFLKFIIIDICLITILAIFWCMTNGGDFSGIISKTADGSFYFNTSGLINYIFSSNFINNIIDFLYQFRQIVISIGILEFILILEKMIFGTAKIRRALKPLDEIAKTANRLSNMTFDEEKFQNLEAAISNISPTSSEQRINMGDSELKGLEDAINQLLDKMRDSYRQQARFVSDASHELRTPISVIQGYANMLDRWGKNDESVLDESIVAIKTESENMKNLVEQLLFLARGINGKTQLNITKFSLSDMIREVLEESKMIDEKHIYSYIDSEEISILGDKALLKQTARILVENSVKYTDDGGCIKFKLGRNSNGEPYFSIQDEGIGMDENDVLHIFERFFRADTARVRKDGGTGLGLSIAKWIIDNHKGYFTVLSRKEIGTRITVVLP